MKKKCIVALGLLAVIVAMTGCGSSKGKELEVFSSKSENSATLQKLIDAYNEKKSDSDRRGGKNGWSGSPSGVLECYFPGFEANHSYRCDSVLYVDLE